MHCPAQLSQGPHKAVSKCSPESSGCGAAGSAAPWESLEHRFHPQPGSVGQGAGVAVSCGVGADLAQIPYGCGCGVGWQL